jgi:excisionase family DNA binding protein
MIIDRGRSRALKGMKRRNTEPGLGGVDSDAMTFWEVAEYMDCSYAKVLLLVMREGLSTFRLGGAGDWRVRRSDLGEWIAQRTRAAGGKRGVQRS